MAIVRSRNAWAMAVGCFCWNYFWYLLVGWGPSYLYTVRHISLSFLGWAAGLMYLIIACTEVTGGWLISALQKRGWSVTRATKSVIVLGFLIGLFIVPACITRDRTLSLFLLYVSALSGVVVSGVLVVPQQCATPGQVGSYVSFQNFIANFPGILGPVVTGWLVRRFDSFVPAFVLGALICVLGIACYVWWLGTLKYEEASPAIS
jgi:ACS family glucarate transporter-like MFS transporter